jgi:hypothetical protein
MIFWNASRLRILTWSKMREERLDDELVDALADADTAEGNFFDEEGA